MVIGFLPPNGGLCPLPSLPRLNPRPVPASVGSIDKALHSLGMRTGYILPERQLPNPMDWLLSEADRLYPLDYILYLVLIFTLVGATISCIQDIGVRVFAVKVSGRGADWVAAGRAGGGGGRGQCRGRGI